MNSVQINCFIAAAKYGSFSKAAASLYLSQPTFSRNIASLEEELGIRLFHRDSFHGIAVTPAGILMLDALTRMRKEVLSALEKARKLEMDTQQSMTLGLLTGQLLDERLEDLLARFRLTYPNVRVTIRRSTYQALMQALRADEIDVTCMPQWQYAEQNGLTIESIGTMDTVLVVPKRLVSGLEEHSYSLREFRAYPIITVCDAESRGNKAMLTQLLASLDMQPPVYEAQSLQEQIQKVEMGEGMILINPYNSVCYSPNVSCVHIRELAPQPFALAWKQKPENDCVTLFQRFLKADGNRLAPHL